MDFDVINYNYYYDDGKVLEGLIDSDCVIIGPSRVGKTPLCFYLGYLGIKAANIPIVPEISPPEILFNMDRKKIIGLKRSPESFQRIRKKREIYLGLKSNYSSLERIFNEIEFSEELYEKLRIATISMDDYSIEETAEFILNRIKK